MENAIMKEC